MAIFNRRRRSRNKAAESAELDISKDPVAVDRNLVLGSNDAAPKPAPEPTEDKQIDVNDGTLPGLGGIKFVTEGAFSVPEFSANLSKDVKRVDVTPPEPEFEPAPKPVQETPAPASVMQMPTPVPAPALRTAKAAPYPKLDPVRNLPPLAAPASKAPEDEVTRLNLGSLRQDMVRITADINTDISQGDALYRRAQKRVEGLLSFVEKAELDYTAINRLEPENRRLKAHNHDLKQELDGQSELIGTLQSNHENQRRQLIDTQGLLDDARRKLATALTAVKRRDDDLRKTLRVVDQLTTKLERQGISADVEASENVTLRQKLRDLSTTLTRMNQDKITQMKMIDSLRNDYDALRNAKGESSASSAHLKASLAASQKRNGELLSHLESLQTDIKAFKTQYEFNLSNRDERIIRLESEVEKLERQVMVKEEVISESAKSVTDMRDRKDNQELDYIRLEKVISDQTKKMAEIRQRLSETEQTNAEYALRIEQLRDPATEEDLAKLEDIINAQATKLKDAEQQIAASQYDIEERDARYDAVSRALEDTQNRLTQEQSAAEEPDITPDIEPSSIEIPKDDSFELPKPASKAAAPTPAPISEESIDEMIMDYTLGLRKNLG